MLVNIFHDTACPWCRIGIKHLLDALEQWQQPATLRWHPFLLDKTIPAEGVEFRSFMRSRKGIPAAELDQLFDYTRQRGQASGVTLDFDKIQLAVNTALSHHLIAIAPAKKKQAIVEAIYRAYFEDGLNIGDINVLIAIGTTAGMDKIGLRQALSSRAALQTIAAEAASSRQYKIFQVPTFLMNNTIRIDGSHSPDVFLRALNRASFLALLKPPYWS